MTSDDYGTRQWFDAKGLLHRRNGPAIECPDGSKHWWVHGRLHRASGPAIDNASGYQRWFEQGKFVRREDPI